MTPIKRLLLVAAFALAVASASAFAFALPGPSACLLLDFADLHTLPDGLRTDSAAAEDRQRYVQLTRDARARIEGIFGPVESRPIIVFFSQPDGFGPFRLNTYGSTQFIGSRACVMVGPKGQNIDVVAHELMHAEIHHRVGYWQRFLQLPAWFDEGVAMQVDFRTRYTLPPEDAGNSGHVRELTSFSSFFRGDEQTIVRNYAAARHVVGAWLSSVGTTSLYGLLGRMRNGEAFAEVVPENGMARSADSSPRP